MIIGNHVPSRRHEGHGVGAGKRDILLIVILAVIFLAIFGIYHAMHQTNGSYAVVQVNGKTYGRYDLAHDRTVRIRENGKVTNTLEIKGGYANMISADCPDKLCVHQARISKKGQTIVCLPNKVVVSIDSSQKSGMDAVAQ